MDKPEIHFIISAPRSGSTWLTTALNGHPDVFGTEHRLFGNFCEVWQNNDGSSSPRITFDKYADAFAMHYFYQFMNRNYGSFVEDFKKSFVNFLCHFASGRTGKNVIVDKITPYPGTAGLVVEEIRRLFPESKIIHLVRDGRDVLTSGTFDWLLKDAEGTDRHEFYFNPIPGMKLERFFDAKVIKKWAENWCETIDVFSDIEPDVSVTYEQMKSDMPEALGSIFAGIGVEVNEQVIEQCVESSTFEKMSGRPPGQEEPTAKARKGIVGDWRNYFTLIDGELFDAFAGEQLKKMGYEPDSEWIKSLPAKLEMIREPGVDHTI
ncbi:MAG: sulfotransferase domain-containing protein [Planctomycetaceae bacterium]|nr:sulfotransferase domain-containing protein [Planctomycetaceae bacterium]